jgi:hypothetical protein
VLTVAPAAGVTVIGEKLQVAYEGSPTHENVTGWLKPFVGVIVIPTLVVCPRWTVNVEALGVSEKSGGPVMTWERGEDTEPVKLGSPE